MRKAVSIICVPVLAGLLATSACNTTKTPDNQQIVTELQSKLFSHPQLKSREISVIASDGVVTISGRVESNTERLQVGELARQVEGVRQVTDMLDVVESKLGEPEVPSVPARPTPRPRLRAPVAPAPAPVRALAPPVPKPEPVRVEVPAGTIVTVRMIDTIDSKRHYAGDEFAASLDTPLTAEGRVVAERGADATVRLIESRTSGRIKGRSELRVELVGVRIQGREYSMDTTAFVAQGGSRGKSTAKKVGGGAAIGSIIGAIAGGGKGAAIGGAIGAGAGTTAQAATKGRQVRLESETRLDFTLRRPLTVTLKAGT